MIPTVNRWEHDRADGRDRVEKQQACPEGEFGGQADLVKINSTSR